MFFDYQKVSLKLDVNKTVFLPGETITGKLLVNVAKPLEITAVRIRVRGIENASLKVKKRAVRRGSKRSDSQSIVHFDKLCTVFGYSQESGRKGGARLDAGAWEYPFTVELPPIIPPSYAMSIKGGESSLVYKLTAKVDIPNGFDADEEQLLTVLSVVPRGQLEHMMTQPRIDKDLRCGLVGKKKCCMSRDYSPYVDVKTSCQPIMVTGGNREITIAENLTTPPSRLIVTVSITNHSTNVNIPAIRVTLKQYRTLSIGKLSKSDIVSIAHFTHIPSEGSLGPRSSAVFDACLDVADSMSLHTRDVKKLKCLPTFATGFVETSNLLSIDFPKCKAVDEMVYSDVSWIVSAVDENNSAGPVPVRFVNPCILPEEKLGGAM